MCDWSEKLWKNFIKTVEASHLQEVFIEDEKQAGEIILPTEDEKMAIETRNAKIDGTMLGIEDHGIMTFMIYLDYGDSSHQGFGGYGLDAYDEKTKKRVGTAFGCDAILKLLDTVGVETWEKLIGKSVRVKSEWTKVHAIGHYLEDRWLDLGKLGEKHNKSK